jgi:hypothetical protein
MPNNLRKPLPVLENMMEFTYFNVTVHRANFFIIKPTRCTKFTIYFVMKLYMFRTLPLSIIRNLFTVHSAMVYSYVIDVCRQLSSRTRMEPRFYYFLAL